MKKDGEYLVFDNAKIDDVSVEDMKPLDMSVIAKQIAEACNEAILQKIEANTIIINEKYAKSKNMVCPGPFGGKWNIPPMLCGLRVKFEDLPEKFAFALTKFPIKTEQELKEEVRKQTAKEIYNWLVEHSYDEESIQLTKAFHESFLEDEV